MCIIPQFVIQSKKTVSLRLYYGNEKYLGENCFPLSDFATYEVSNHSQTVGVSFGVSFIVSM